MGNPKEEAMHRFLDTQIRNVELRTNLLVAKGDMRPSEAAMTAVAAKNDIEYFRRLKRLLHEAVLTDEDVLDLIWDEPKSA